MTLPTPLELGAIGTAMITGAIVLFIFLKVFEASIILGALGAAMLVCAGVASGYKKMGVDAQLAIDKPIMAACATDRDKAIAANVSLQGDVKRMGEEQAAQNEAVNALRERTEAAIARSAKAQSGNAAKVRMLESDQAMIFKQAAGALKGLSCPQVVTKLTDELHGLAVREFGDRPPVAEQPKPAKAGLSIQ